jgi:hypothetical protein
MPANISLDAVSTAASQAHVKTNSIAAITTSKANATVAAATSPKLANPRLTVDPTVNRVVLEFFSSSGVLTNTIPSQSQLEAYRLAAFSGKPVSAAAAAADA